MQVVAAMPLIGMHRDSGVRTPVYLYVCVFQINGLLTRCEVQHDLRMRTLLHEYSPLLCTMIHFFRVLAESFVCTSENICLDAFLYAWEMELARLLHHFLEGYR